MKFMACSCGRTATKRRRNNNNNTRNQRGKRDPDCTLVIKNITSDTTEADVRGLFEPFAGETGTKVIGLTVSGARSIAFVDFDSPKPVLAAVEKFKENPSQLNGRNLEIYQKTADQKRRNQGGRGGYGGGRQGNGRQYRRSGSGAGRDRGGGGGRGGGRGGGGGGRS
mmetsp:Transcript_1586/g.4342  ORF Transcript_1586/g.4342 Transcript_1586/m.4342 type:complete len:167 (-) Transcript_1586:289-789(-)